MACSSEYELEGMRSSGASGGVRYSSFAGGNNIKGATFNSIYNDVLSYCGTTTQAEGTTLTEANINAAYDKILEGANTDYYPPVYPWATSYGCKVYNSLATTSKKPKREDLMDSITDISPSSTPLLKMLDPKDVEVKPAHIWSSDGTSKTITFKRYGEMTEDKISDKKIHDSFWDSYSNTGKLPFTASCK